MTKSYRLVVESAPDLTFADGIGAWLRIQWDAPFLRSIAVGVTCGNSILDCLSLFVDDNVRARPTAAAAT